MERPERTGCVAGTAVAMRRPCAYCGTPRIASQPMAGYGLCLPLLATKPLGYAKRMSHPHIYKAGPTARAFFWLLNLIHGILPFGGERTARQRHRYAADFEHALKLDCIEQGVVPLAKAVYECGGDPLFSCEGHPELDTRKSWSPAHFIFWIPSEAAAFWNGALERSVRNCVLWWEITSKESSAEKNLASPHNGKSGLHMTIKVATLDPHGVEGLAGVRQLLDDDFESMANSILTLAGRRPERKATAAQ